MKNSYEHRPSDSVSQRIKDVMGIKRQKTYASPKPEGAVPARTVSFSGCVTESRDIVHQYIRPGAGDAMAMRWRLSRGGVMDDKELLRQALHALEDNAYNTDTERCNACSHEFGGHHSGCDIYKAIEALRARLAQPIIDGHGGNLDAAFDAVAMPTNVQQAEAMMRVASHWLQANAPELLRAMLRATAPVAPDGNAAEILAGLFNCMPTAALKNDVPMDLARRIGAFMVANGYRMVFDKWYLQEPPAPAAPAVREPLHQAQLINAYCNTLGIHQFVQAFVAGARYAEAHHGIGTQGGGNG